MISLSRAKHFNEKCIQKVRLLVDSYDRDAGCYDGGSSPPDEEFFDSLGDKDGADLVWRSGQIH